MSYVSREETERTGYKSYFPEAFTMIEKQKACKGETVHHFVQLDIVRCVAVLSVISVHFFKHNGFYTVPVQGTRMYIMLFMRTFFMCCVPLFMMLTGYLMAGKRWTGISYYKGITKTLATFALVHTATLIYQRLALNRTYTLPKLVMSYFDFSQPNSWYVEMYIGLFLLAPFLNLIYQGLVTEKQKTAWIVTLLALTALPKVVNAYAYTSNGWDFQRFNSYQKLVPGWWTEIYPITYYCLGSYLRDHPFRIKKRFLLSILVLVTVLNSTYVFWRCYNQVFEWGPWQDWGSLQNVIPTVLVFLLCLNVDAEKLSQRAQELLIKVSSLSFGVYLLSAIFDEQFYPILNQTVPDVHRRLEYFILLVPLNFICSLICAALIERFRKTINSLIKRVRSTDKLSAR